MKRVVPALLSLLLAVPAYRAGEPPKNKDKADKAVTPEQQYKDLVHDFDAQSQKFFQAYRKAKTAEERQKLLKENPPPDRMKFAAKVLKLAEEHPKSSFAPEALTWVITHTGLGAGAEPYGPKARDLLFKDHINSKALAPVVGMLGDMPSPENVELLRRVIKENPHHDVKGQATFALAQILAYQKKNKDAEQQFEKVVKDYADVKDYRGSLADRAKGELFELQHLAVGMVAPNIVGVDVDGKRFQLKDYRGKVVVLDFWAEW